MIQTPPNRPPSAGVFLRIATEIVEGSRNATHGDKERSFEAIAGLWASYLSKNNPNIQISPVDVAWMMVLLKIVRSQHGTFIADHAIDAAGYSAIAGELGVPTSIKIPPLNSSGEV